ncbi:MAG: hypothetical protein AAGF53_03235 [Pseudomonadota bacterium]
MVELPEMSQLTSNIPAPLDRIIAQAGRVAIVCDLLEAIADSLPAPAAGACAEAARLCALEIPRHFDEVQNALIPVLREHVRQKSQWDLLLDQLERNIAEDNVRLEELIEVLWTFNDTKTRRLNSEALGYVLRGYFEGMRRQLSWEEAILTPISLRVLREADLKTIASSMAKRAAGHKGLGLKELSGAKRSIH